MYSCREFQMAQLTNFTNNNYKGHFTLCIGDRAKWPLVDFIEGCPPVECERFHYN